MFLRLFFLTSSLIDRCQIVTDTCVTGTYTDFPVCVIRSIFIRKLLHLTISSPFISINQKNALKTTVAFE